MAHGDGTTPAAGNTASVEPTASSRSHAGAASSARKRSSATRLWPKLMVADFRMPAALDVQARVVLAGAHPVVHGLGRLAVAARQADHVARGAVDLDDARRVGAGLLVQPVDVLGHQRVEAAAALEVDQGPVAGVGLASPTWARSAGSARSAGAARGRTRRPAASPSSRPRGSWSTRPAGPRKSGMPESVEMPAPVSTTTRRACSQQGTRPRHLGVAAVSPCRRRMRRRRARRSIAGRNAAHGAGVRCPGARGTPHRRSCCDAADAEAAPAPGRRRAAGPGLRARATGWPSRSARRPT